MGPVVQVFHTILIFPSANTSLIYYLENIWSLLVQGFPNSSGKLDAASFFPETEAGL